MCPEHAKPQQGGGSEHLAPTRGFRKTRHIWVELAHISPTHAGHYLKHADQFIDYQVRKAPCTSPVSDPARFCFRNLHVSFNIETRVSPYRCWTSSLYPTKIIPLPPSYSAGWGALILHNLSVVLWLPACLGSNPCPANTAWLLTSRIHGLMLDLTKKQTNTTYLYRARKPKCSALVTYYLILHLSSDFMSSVAVSFSPQKPQTEVLNCDRARPEPHQSSADTIPCSRVCSSSVVRLVNPLPWNPLSMCYINFIYF